MAFTGGAAQVVSDVFNLMVSTASSKTTDASNAIKAALAEANPVPQMAPVDVVGDYVIPNLPDIGSFDPTEIQRLYEDTRAALEATVGTKLDSFMADYFPSTAGYDAAMNWLNEAIANGGTGIRPAVEQQLWERGRARILGDSERAEGEAMATWANRGFPIPPGALTSQVNQIRLDAGRKLAEQSRDITVKSFDAELENTRFAVAQVLDLRFKAISAAGDYIKTIMLGPQLASQLALSQVDAKVRIATALTSLYGAEVSAQEPRVRMILGQADIKTRIGEANLRASSGALEARVRAAMEYAQMLGNQAAAGLNALHGGASISGSDSSVV